MQRDSRRDFIARYLRDASTGAVISRRLEGRVHRKQIEPMKSRRIIYRQPASGIAKERKRAQSRWAERGCVENQASSR